MILVLMLILQHAAIVCVEDLAGQNAMAVEDHYDK